MCFCCGASTAWGQDATAPESDATQTETDPLLAAVAEAADDRDPGLGTRAALDLSTRHLVATSDGDWDGVTAIGLDVLQMLSSNNTDWGRVLLQGYLLGSHQWEEHPPFVADSTAWTPTVRLAYVDLTGPLDDKLALRVGHIAIPYGINLPITVNANGTLQQYLSVPNLGLMLDYGASLHGELTFLEYEVMVGRGSGMNYVGTEGTWVVSGRVGSPELRPIVVGGSVYRGHQLTPAGVLDRTRMGVDARYYGPIDAMVEASVGTDAGTTRVFNSIEQVSWRTASDGFMAYVQHRYLHTGLGSGTTANQSVVPGIRYFPWPGWTLEANYDRALSGAAGQPPRQVLGVQLRNRWAFGSML